MKKIFLSCLSFVFVICFFSKVNSQTAIAPVGTGAQCDPYQINSLENLYWMSQTTASWAAGKYFIQTANIDASTTNTWNSNAGWSPVGNLSTRFYANYDGRGNTISNLYINRTGSGIGFFGFTQSGMIQNMNFINVSLTAVITNVNGVGILSAYSYLSTFTNCKITNSTFNTSGSQTYAGTMFGRMSNVTVSFCNSTVNAVHTNSSAVHAPYGGLIGSLESGGTITFSYATGNVSKSNGGNRTGGFIGVIEAGTISKCYATGNVTTANQGGGFVGNTYICSISDSYSTGNVNSTASDGKGSFAGFSQSGSTFTRCYGSGILSGYTGGWSGGFSGYTTDASFNNCFFDQTTTGYSNAFGYSSNNIGLPTATTTANMKQQSTFSNSGWDFTSTWAIVVGNNNGYPTLIIPSVTIEPLLTGCPSWIGSTSSDWGTASNWSNNVVPSTGVNIVINTSASNDLMLDQPRSIGILFFNGANKKVDIGNYDLTVTSITGANASNFVKTSDIGKLKQSHANNISAVYPIGNSTYNPVIITNKSGASDVFSARVIDALYVNGVSGTAVSSTAVNRTWDISKTNANAGSGVDFVFNWNAGEVANGSFYLPEMNHFSGSAWEVPVVSSSTVGTNALTVVGYTGTFSPFSIQEGSGLPVELTTFNANCTENTTTINWQTASEHNSAYFDVEKSRDGNNWSLLESIQAAGNSTALLDYSVVDSEKSTNVVYYRLNQVDQDGISKIYGPISAACNADIDFNAHVFPNPTSGAVTLVLNTSIPQTIAVQLIGTDGKIYRQATSNIAAGSTLLPLEIADLKAGIYSVNIQGESTIQTVKVVVL